MRKISPYLLIGLFAVASCTQDRGTSSTAGQVLGYAPVYMAPAASKQISSGAAQATKNAGKIYAYQNYLFQIEQGAGIHVIDNSNPQQASKVAFITVPGCSEIAIKGGYLYTNNINDLVVLNLAAGFASPTVVNRQENAFPQLAQNYPPFTGVYFECVDASKGTVVGWEQKTLTNPGCRR